jgi:23S rRNA (pseudouridine1915-N3)-methyltransferase
MRISLWAVGKTNESYLKTGMEIYFKRLRHYCDFEYLEFKDVALTSRKDELIKKEGRQFLDRIKPEDVVILLDEKGTKFSSSGFADFVQSLQNRSVKSVIFIIGGAFGHHDALLLRAHKLVSLSEMTFSHQMVRLIFAEQLYRAFTIIRNEKYHNE